MPIPRLRNPDDPGEHDALVFLLECGGAADPQGLAARLLRDHGGLFEAVRAASGEGFGDELRALAAVTAHAGVKYDDRISAGGRSFADTETAGRFFEAWFAGQDVEQLVMLCLDEDFRAVDCRILATGSETAVRFKIDALLEFVRLASAEYVVLAHNHPHSSALPSREDITTTALIAYALHACGAALLDHIIVYRDDYISLRESDILSQPDGRARSEFMVRHGRINYREK